MSEGEEFGSESVMVIVRPTTSRIGDANMPLRGTPTDAWARIQGQLFPWLQEDVGPLTDGHKRFVTVLDMAGIGRFVQTWAGLPGRPLGDRHALARR